MSMSMRVDRNAPRSSCTIEPRTPSTWIPDERVKRCYACNAHFTAYRRKHHCRGCGRIFCNGCSSHRMVIPTFWLTYAPSPAIPDKVQRMCGTCVEHLSSIIDVEWLVRALSVMPVTFSELFSLRLLDKIWNRAVNTLFSFYRGLQYKLPCQPYTQIESDFLRAHYSEFHKHIPWQIHTLVSLYQNQTPRAEKILITREVRIYTCRHLLCSRTCRQLISMDDIIRLGTTGVLYNKNVRSQILAAWNLMQPQAFAQMMFWWVYLACRYKKLFNRGLIPLCSKYLETMYALWFECEIQKNRKTAGLLLKVQNQLSKKLPAESVKDLTASIHFTQLLDYIAEAGPVRKHIDDFFKKHGSVRLPWNPSKIVINITRTRRFNSSSKPVGLTCILQNNTKIEILVKKEDVRTDRLAMVIGYWINQFAPNQHVHTYNVFPITSQTGCVEMIDGASTLYDIRKNGTLLNHIMSNNQQDTVQNVRERIVSSCVGACLLAFTMGLGDRHLENILVTNRGHLAHVDFGYILGDDPKWSATPMRITEDMVEAMGGENSPSFKSFILRTQQGYNNMRMHASFWYHLLVSEWFIHENKNRHWKRVRDHILDRFVPGEFDHQAELQIQAVVDSARDYTLLQRVSDLTHAASNGIEHLFHMEL